MCGKAYECGTGRGQFKRVQRSRTAARTRPKGAIPRSQCGVAPLAKDAPLANGTRLALAPWDGSDGALFYGTGHWPEGGNFAAHL